MVVNGDKRQQPTHLALRLGPLPVQQRRPVAVLRQQAPQELRRLHLRWRQQQCLRDSGITWDAAVGVPLQFCSGPQMVTRRHLTCVVAVQQLSPGGCAAKTWTLSSYRMLTISCWFHAWWELQQQCWLRFCCWDASRQAKTLTTFSVPCAECTVPPVHPSNPES